MTHTRLIFERQWLHAVAIILSLAGLAALISIDSFRAGHLWGIATPTWFWLATAVAIAHQVFVWICWRTQLHGASLTQALGARAFPLYAIGFSILGIARVIAVFILAIANRDALSTNPLALKTLAVVALIPALYLFYSVKRYFGFKRAFGIDHFDESYRSKPFVRKGIFRFTRNGMYFYGFLILWVPGLWFASPAALAIALFNHIYIWVHYFATERPDINRIYAESSDPA